MKQIMKRRILIIIFFIIATTASALHELKHVENHDSSLCQICIVDDHSVSADIISDTPDESYSSFYNNILNNQLSSPHAKKVANHSNAPPIIS